MTVIEALKKSVNILNGVNVPISMLQKVGAPVSSAISLIQASVDALERGAMQQPKEEHPEEPEKRERDELHEESSVTQNGKCYAASEDALDGNPPAVAEDEI